MTLWFELKASHIISVRTRTRHLRSETLERPVLPHPPDPRTSTHTHTRDHKCNFSITFFPPLSPTLLAAPIDPDRPQTKGGNADSYSQRFIQGTRKASSTGICASLPPPQTLRSFLEEKFNLFQPGRRKAAQFQGAQLAHGCIFLMQRSSKRNAQAFRKCWTFTVAVAHEGKRT